MKDNKNKDEAQEVVQPNVGVSPKLRPNDHSNKKAYERFEERLKKITYNGNQKYSCVLDNNFRQFDTIEEAKSFFITNKNNYL